MLAVAAKALKWALIALFSFVILWTLLYMAFSGIPQGAYVAERIDAMKEHIPAAEAYVEGHGLELQLLLGICDRLWDKQINVRRNKVGHARVGDAWLGVTENTVSIFGSRMKYGLDEYYGFSSDEKQALGKLLETCSWISMSYDEAILHYMYEDNQGNDTPIALSLVNRYPPPKSSKYRYSCKIYGNWHAVIDYLPRS